MTFAAVPRKKERKAKLDEIYKGSRKPSTAGTWIGDRTICRGDYHVDTELPKIPPHNGNLLTKEGQELRYARTKYKDMPNPWHFARGIYENFWHPKNGWSFDNDLVLRNLTTHEYVQDAYMPKYATGPFCAIGIGWCCWYTDDSQINLKRRLS